MGRNFVLKMMEKQSGSYWGPDKVESKSLQLFSVYCLGMYVGQHTFLHKVAASLVKVTASHEEQMSLLVNLLRF